MVKMNRFVQQQVNYSMCMVRRSETISSQIQFLCAVQSAGGLRKSVKSARTGDCSDEWIDIAVLMLSVSCRLGQQGCR
jgi:hypothetical protein